MAAGMSHGVNYELIIPAKKDWDAYLRKKLDNPRMISEIDLLFRDRAPPELSRTASAARLTPSRYAVVCSGCRRMIRANKLGRHQSSCLSFRSLTDADLVTKSTVQTKDTAESGTTGVTDASSYRSRTVSVPCKICGQFYSEFVISLHELRCLRVLESNLGKNL